MFSLRDNYPPLSATLTHFMFVFLSWHVRLYTSHSALPSLIQNSMLPFSIPLFLFPGKQTFRPSCPPFPSPKGHSYADYFNSLSLNLGDRSLAYSLSPSTTTFTPPLNAAAPGYRMSRLLPSLTLNLTVFNNMARTTMDSARARRMPRQTRGPMPKGV